MYTHKQRLIILIIFIVLQTIITHKNEDIKKQDKSEKNSSDTIFGTATLHFSSIGRKILFNTNDVKLDNFNIYLKANNIIALISNNDLLIDSTNFTNLFDSMNNGFYVEKVSFTLTNADYEIIIEFKKKPNTLKGLFAFSEAEKISLQNFDITDVQNMEFMFLECKFLTSIELNDFDTSGIKSMYQMFSGCISLSSIDLSSLDTRNVKNMGYMFYSCSNLTSVNLSNFDTSNTINMESMFKSCSSLTSINLDNFDTSNVKNMQLMFSGCTSLININIGNLNLDKITQSANVLDFLKNVDNLKYCIFPEITHSPLSKYFLRNCSELIGFKHCGKCDDNLSNDTHCYKTLRVGKFGANEGSRLIKKVFHYLIEEIKLNKKERSCFWINGLDSQNYFDKELLKKYHYINDASCYNCKKSIKSIKFKEEFYSLDYNKLCYNNLSNPENFFRYIYYNCDTNYNKCQEELYFNNEYANYFYQLINNESNQEINNNINEKEELNDHIYYGGYISKKLQICEESYFICINSFNITSKNCIKEKSNSLIGKKCVIHNIDFPSSMDYNQTLKEINDAVFKYILENYLLQYYSLGNNIIQYKNDAHSITIFNFGKSFNKISDKLSKDLKISILDLEELYIKFFENQTNNEDLIFLQIDFNEKEKEINYLIYNPKTEKFLNLINNINNTIEISRHFIITEDIIKNLEIINTNDIIQTYNKSEYNDKKNNNITNRTKMKIAILYEDPELLPHLNEETQEFESTNIPNDKNISFPLILEQKDINITSFASPQLRNPNNINIINNISISLNIENENYIHLKIKDPKNKRWEVPEYDILNKDYIKKLKNKNKISENFKLISTFENNTFSFKLIDKNSNEFFSFNTSENFLFSDTYINFEFLLSSNNIYGFGERSHNFKLEDGIYTTWPHDCGGTKYDDGEGGMNQYSHQPIALHKTKYKNLWLGFVFLNTNAQDIIINSIIKNPKISLMHKTIGGIINYYIIVNNSPIEILKNIQFLLGFPTLPPYWSLGYHQSRYGYNNFNDFKEVYENFKEYEISIDTMWIDIDSLENFEIFTINEKFKEISNYVNDIIHKDGGKFVPIVDLGISYENKNNPYVKIGNDLNLFIKSNYTKKFLTAKVWPGKTVIPDFFNPKINFLWNKGLKNYYNLIKYDGIWLDMNEPANLLENSKCIGEISTNCDKNNNKYFYENLPYLPGYKKNRKETLSLGSINENALLYGNYTIYDIKPMISFYQIRYTYDFLKNNLKKRPFILSRSTSISEGKFTFHWIGDNFSNLDNLKFSISGIFNFNIFGIPFTGSDICGFMEHSNKNLCVRWYNIGVFYPFARNHNFFNAVDQYPWSFDDEAKNIIQKDINYRYSLIKYMYSQFFLITLNEKSSFFQPVLFEFPEDENSYVDIEYKVMFGEAFLICVFFENENKKFVLPKNNFNLYPSGKNIMNYYDSEREIELSGKLDELHIFLRGGFIVPMQNCFEKYIINTEKLREEKISLIINVDNIMRAKGILFFDNDEVDTVSKKKYFRVEMEFNNKKLMFKMENNALKNYNYKDHYLDKIEIWRVNEVFESNIENVKMNLIYKNNKQQNMVHSLQPIIDNDNNKIVFEFSKENDEMVSIFNIKEISFY